MLQSTQFTTPPPGFTNRIICVSEADTQANHVWSNVLVNHHWAKDLPSSYTDLVIVEGLQADRTVLRLHWLG